MVLSNSHQGVVGHTSWAPLMPAGPWWNPKMPFVNGSTLTLQNQSAWLLMTPIFYGLVIKLYRNDVHASKRSNVGEGAGQGDDELGGMLLNAASDED